MDTAYTFDDLFISPRYSEIESRNDVDISTKFTTNFSIRIPIIAAPMDSVCGLEMADRLGKLGGVGCLHRFWSIEKQIDAIPRLYDVSIPTCASIGVNGDFEERAEALVENGITVILIDIAHGHHIAMKRALALFNQKPWRSKVDIIAGNIATLDAAKDLESWGADALRVGIGGGSMCTTRIQTGVGVPQLQTILDIAPNVNIPVISDGGIRNAGDVAKCLAAGASSVMIGKLFAGTNETPGDEIGVFPYQQKVYRGSASMSAKADNGQKKNYIEGVSTVVNVVGPVAFVIERLLDGVRSSMSYVGARNLKEFSYYATFNRVSQAGLVEAHPHGVK